MLDIIGFEEREERLFKIKDRLLDVDKKIEDTVRRIVNDVRLKGDEAVRFYTKKFDGVKIDDFKVRYEDIEKAYREVDSELSGALKEVYSNVDLFHRGQLPRSWFGEFRGIMLGHRITPVEKVGVYVPGGKSAYPSTVMMAVVPARIAGVRNIYVVSPPDKNGKVNKLILAACHIAGIYDVYSIGGAQAVAALAYGTETVPKVDKIVGPGNIYVSLAKKMVYGDVDIDMIAGPSEVVIISDGSVESEIVAADIVAQAEHDEMSVAILVTTDEKFAFDVKGDVEKLVPSFPKKDIIEASLRNFGSIFIARDMEDAAEIVNRIAPEHVEILTSEPFEVLPMIRNAGAIFLGKFSPVAVGDYIAGPSHILPTGGSARFRSVLNVEDFIKRTSIVAYMRRNLDEERKSIKILAEAEGLHAHSFSIEARFRKKGED